MTDLVSIRKETLTPAEFQALADVPPELEWLANIANPKTRRAYKIDVAEFIAFTGLQNHTGLRTVGRPHVIAWRKDMEARKLAPSRIRRKLSALASLFDYLAEHNAFPGNPVHGVRRPAANGNEGSTPALGEGQAGRLLEAPPAGTLKGVRDRAIPATLLYHGIRREELVLLRPMGMHTREGVPHFRVLGKGGKIRFIPIHSVTLRLVNAYMEMAQRHGVVFELDGPLFRPVVNNRTGTVDRALDPGAVYRNIVVKYARDSGVAAEAIGTCVHSMRATAATNALSNESDIAKVQEWLGHANIATTRLYDRRKSEPEDSPTFHVKYGKPRT